MTVRQSMTALVVLLFGLITLTGSSADRRRPGVADDMAAAVIDGDVVYATGRLIDVYASAGERHQRPVVVLVHGCCGDRADLGRLSEAMASAGAIAMNADWAGIKPEARFPASYADVACAVRFARARAADFGGSPNNVTLLGWSDGAMAAAVVAVRGDALSRSHCRYPGWSGVPDATVGVAGFYGWTLPVDPYYVNDRARRWLGGTPQTATQAWHDATPYAWLGSSAPHCLSVLVSEMDPLRSDAERYVSALRRTGHRPRLVVADRAGDPSMISPRTAEGQLTVQQTLLAGQHC